MDVRGMWRDEGRVYAAVWQYVVGSVDELTRQILRWEQLTEDRTLETEAEDSEHEGGILWSVP